MRRFLRVVFWVIVVCIASLALVVGPLFLQNEPALEASLPPSPADVAATRQLVRDLRQVSGTAHDSPTLRTDITQLNSAIRLGTRFIDGFRGDVALENQAIHGRISIPIPWWRGQKWLNIAGIVPEFEDNVMLSQVSVGSTNLPPAMVLTIARISANLIIGNDFGDKVMNAASQMQISGDSIRFDVTLNQIGQNGMMQNVFGRIRGQAFPNPEEIETYYLRIRTAMDDGRLSATGSFLPYIQFTLTQALENSTPETLPNAYAAAIFGLAQTCGAARFGIILDRMSIDNIDTTREWSTTCDEVTFNGRIDSRRHFITSAALQAATNSGISFSVGELKELYDIVSGAGGYDFTDMAANLSGLRMSDYLMSMPAENWSNKLARLRTERDVIVSFQDIPPLMPEADFNTRYTDVESIAYKEMLARIESRIDQLFFYGAD